MSYTAAGIPAPGGDGVVLGVQQPGTELLGRGGPCIMDGYVFHSSRLTCA